MIEIDFLNDVVDLLMLLSTWKNEKYYNSDQLSGECQKYIYIMSKRFYPIPLF